MLEMMSPFKSVHRIHIFLYVHVLRLFQNKDTQKRMGLLTGLKQCDMISDIFTLRIV